MEQTETAPHPPPPFPHHHNFCLTEHCNRKIIFFCVKECATAVGRQSGWQTDRQTYRQTDISRQIERDRGKERQETGRDGNSKTERDWKIVWTARILVSRYKISCFYSILMPYHNQIMIDHTHTHTHTHARCNVLTIEEICEAFSHFSARWRAPYMESVSVQLSNASSPSKNTNCRVTSDACHEIITSGRWFFSGHNTSQKVKFWWTYQIL